MKCDNNKLFLENEEYKEFCDINENNPKQISENGNFNLNKKRISDKR